jgi:hypothetical protein
LAWKVTRTGAVQSMWENSDPRLAFSRTQPAAASSQTSITGFYTQEGILSALVPYVVNDFAWDDLADQFDRTDGTTIRPRTTDVGLSARDRFTKFKPKVNHRLDLSGAPRSYTEATTRVPERRTTKDEPPITTRTARQISKTLHHYDTGWVHRL